MKNSSAKITEFQASLIIAGVVSVLLLVIGTVLAFFGKPGWLIGFAIGSAVDFLYIWLIHVGSAIALKESKAGLFLLTYFVRVIAFVGLFALLVVLQYMLHVVSFNNSCWGMLIAFVPATFITIASELIFKEKDVK